MNFTKAFIHQIFWVALIGLINWLSSSYYPTDGFTTDFSWLSFSFFSLLLLSAFIFAKAIIWVKPKINLTVVVFGILSFRFLFTLFFYGAYYFTKHPEGTFFVIPFMLMFFYFLIIENVYLLKYANYVYKNFQSDNK